MLDQVILVLSSAGGGVAIKALFDYVTQRRVSKDAAQRSQIDITSEIRRAEIEAHSSTESRLWKRVSELEKRMDVAHQECMEQITREVARESAACDQKMAQLRKEFQLGLDELTEDK